jgi:VWFA-related protein
LLPRFTDNHRKMGRPAEKLTRRGAFLTLLFVSIAVTAQEPAIRSDVKEVLVPVVVTDRHGHHVQNLKKSDFQVLEDGKPQPIVALTTESTGIPVSISQAAASGNNPSTGVPTSPTGPDTPRRTYLILVDTLHSSFANFGRVREALGKFFEKEQAVDAQYAVMALGRELKVVQDSTRDVKAALAAVRASRFSNMILDSEANNLTIAAEQFTALMRQYCSSCVCESTGQIGGKEMGECSSSKIRVEAFLNSFVERTFPLNQAFLRQLNEVVRATATMPTSRTVIFISDGFNRFSGRELYAVLLGYAPRDRSFEFNSRDTQPELDAVLKVATRNNVKFYTIDSRGLYTVMSVPGGGFAASSSPGPTNVQVDSRAQPNLAAGVPEAVTSHATSAARESTDVLAELAHQTGGLFFENNNDLLKGLRQAVADGREYYVLAYVPENKSQDETYRKILVTVKEPKWRVSAKAGYWATGVSRAPTLK